MARKKGGRGLISCEGCVKEEENNLSWYIKNSEEIMLVTLKITLTHFVRNHLKTVKKIVISRRN